MTGDIFPKKGREIRHKNRLLGGIPTCTLKSLLQCLTQTEVHRVYLKKAEEKCKLRNALYILAS